MIRDAQPSDLERMVELGRIMHEESPVFSRFPFNEKKISGLLSSTMLSPFGYLRLIEQQGIVTGGLVGALSEYPFNKQHYASEQFVFVHPDSRGSLLALRLIRDFEEWARGRGALEVVLGISTGTNAEQTAALYDRLGFMRQGTIHRKALLGQGGQL